MIDHIGFGVSDYERSKAFYERALEPLGVSLLMEPVAQAGGFGSDGKPYREQITYVKDRPGHDRRYAIDARKLERELGWKPAETFESGIRKTVQWYLSHEDWVSHVQSGAYRDWVQKQYASESAA